MQSRWMTILAVAALSAALGSGCANLGSSPEEGPMAKRFEGTLAGPDASSVTLAKRFEGTLAGPDASSATVELTARYTQLAEKAAVLQQQNQTLSEENDRFKKQVDALEAQLKQTQTELTEANTLLVDMLGELNNWKSDILGFRNEMRLAAKAQLEALLKILEVLGAEAGPLAPVVEPNQPKPNKAGPSDPSK